VGDAPIQGCDFNALIQTTGLDAWARERWLRNLASKACAIFAGPPACWCMASASPRRISSRKITSRSSTWDVKACSNRSATTEPVRVAWYDHRLMRRRISGVHQYLVAKEVVDADVIINLPS